MRREIQVIPDSAGNWPTGTVPQDISQFAGPQIFDVDVALIHTALWTRPPQTQGFDLADCWAWLRYASAFDPDENQNLLNLCPRLRMRPEWSEIDSHQKVVASDQLGVGFSTQFLVERLGIQFYVDTAHLVKKHPQWFRPGVFGQGKKRGPQKTPDYIAFDRSRRISILECKGSQTSLRDLQDSMSRGRAQKRNIGVQRPARLRHSLVIGLFVPQAESSESAALAITDPTWEAIVQGIGEMPERDLYITLAGIALSKHFALMGLNFMVDALMNYEHAGVRHRLFDSDDVVARRLIDTARQNRYTFSAALPPIQLLDNTMDARFHRRRFTMGCDEKLFEQLVRSDDIGETLYQLVRGLTDDSTEVVREWKTSSVGDALTEVVSPFGFWLQLKHF